MSDRPTRVADMKTNIVRLLSENAKLKRERDEARADLEVRRDLCDEAREKYFVMRDLSNNATELSEKYKRERDEARESAAKWEAVALREASINGARICAKEDAK